MTLWEMDFLRPILGAWGVFLRVKPRQKITLATHHFTAGRPGRSYSGISKLRCLFRLQANWNQDVGFLFLAVSRACCVSPRQLVAWLMPQFTHWQNQVNCLCRRHKIYAIGSKIYSFQGLLESLDCPIKVFLVSGDFRWNLIGNDTWTRFNS